MKRRLPLAGTALLLLLVLQAALYAMLWTRLLGDPSLRTMDFIHLYSAGRLLRAGEPARVYDIEAMTAVQMQVVQVQGYSPLIFNHPPFFLPLLGLVAVNDYVRAYILWSALRLLVVVACGWLIHRFLLRSGWDAASAWLGALGCVLFYPIFISILGGQDTVFALLGLLIWMDSLLRGRAAAAGISMAFSTLVPTIAGALALPWMISQPRRSLPFLLALTGLGLYSLILIGVEGMKKFMALLAVSSAAGSYGFSWKGMYNLAGILSRSFPGLNSDTLRLLIWGAAFTSILAVSLLWLGKRLRMEHIGLAVLAATFTSPHLYLHTLSVLILPLAAFLVILWRGGRRSLALLFVPGISTLLLLIGLLKPGWDFPFYYGLMAFLAAALTWSLRSPSALPAPAQEPDRQREPRA